MTTHDIRRRAASTSLAICALCFALPASALHWPALHWPWHRGAASAPQSVQELSVSLQGAGSNTAGDAASGIGNGLIAQYWDRNALLIDLSGVSGEGGAVLAPLPGKGWPARLEFRVRPERIGRLEVVGAQRMVFSLPSQAAAAMVLPLDPGVYLATTAQISLRWRAADDLPR